MQSKLPPSITYLGLFAAANLITQTASALNRGSDPTTTAVTIPGTQTVTDVWKFAGSVANASGVQIGPKWILSAKHVLPSTPDSGVIFKNAFGSSAISQCFWPDLSKYSVTDPTDLVLCRLTQPISATNFPRLSDDPKALTNGLPINMFLGIGNLLHVGFGDPFRGQARFVWSDLLGMPASDYTPGDLGWNAPLPYKDYGDSGSPTFWKSPNADALVLASITSGGGGPRLDQTFLPKTLDWIKAIQASFGEPVINTVTASAYFGGAISASPPWLDLSGIQISPNSYSTPTSFDLAWKAPSTYTQLVKRYLLVIQKGSTVTKSAFINTNTSGTFSYTAVGLETKTPYTVCVLPAGFGIAAMGEAQGFPNTYADFSRNCKPIKLSPAGDVVQGLTMSTSMKTFKGVGTYPTYSVKWTAPTTPFGLEIVGYRIGTSVDGEAEQFADIMSIGTVDSGGLRQTGQKICVTVTPISSPKTLGTKSQPICATMP